MRMIGPALLAVALLVSACACGPTRAQIDARDDTTCRQAGTVDTPEYGSCRQRLANARSAYETYRLVLVAGVLRNR